MGRKYIHKTCNVVLRGWLKILINRVYLLSIIEIEVSNRVMLASPFISAFTMFLVVPCSFDKNLGVAPPIGPCIVP